MTMQFHQSIQLSANGIAAIIGDEPDRFDNIADELENHTADISSLLTSYHWNEKAMVHTLKINRQSIEIDKSGKGRFTVNYGTNIHYGCSDIDIELENKMTINIKVDMQTRKAILTGEYIPEREPDSY
jgi:hypothetical protein